jgi:hypothetical protein
MKKVGIVSCYFNKNYGSMLQAYASQKILDKYNIENETIDITLLNIEIRKNKRKYYLRELFNIGVIKARIKQFLSKFYYKIINRKTGKNIEIRNKKFEEFKKNFKLSIPYRNFKELNEICNNYNAVIVGSDQLWLPNNVIGDYYTLNFVPDNINKIAYATSFGISHIPTKFKKEYSNFLRRLNYIFVREDDGKKLVKEMADINAKLVCDPTLLLDKNDWEELTTRERFITDKYIFCYFLGNNIEHRKFAERLREKTGYSIISLNHLDEYVKYSDKFADEIPYNIGPGDFINLIKHAEYICTDSFHGTIFSLINNKNFFTFSRHKSTSKQSTNSRVTSLLNTVNLHDRLLTGNEEVENVINKVIDYKEVNLKLTEFREESTKLLIDAINRGI